MDTCDGQDFTCKFTFGKITYRKVSIECILLFQSRRTVVPIHWGQTIVWGIPVYIIYYSPISV